jgi:hypothetical protein
LLLDIQIETVALMTLVDRALHLPLGVAETVLEYMPLPRIWEWSLSKLKLRCELCPTQAVTDLSILIDEILCDANIISGPDQKHMLVNINYSSSVSCRFNTH